MIMPSDKTDFFILFFFHPDFTVGTVMATFASTVLPSTPSALPFSVMSYGVAWSVSGSRTLPPIGNYTLPWRFFFYVVANSVLAVMSILLLPCLRFSGCKVIKKNVFSIIYCKKIVVRAIKKTIFGHAEVQPYIIIWCYFRGSPRLSASTLLVL